MSKKTTLTFVLMDAPFESARTTTAMRLLDVAARRGYDINVFAYEGAVYLPFIHQTAHPNAVHGHDVEEENHPLPKDWVSALIEEAEATQQRMEAGMESREAADRTRHPERRSQSATHLRQTTEKRGRSIRNA